MGLWIEWNLTDFGRVLTQSIMKLYVLKKIFTFQCAFLIIVISPLVLLSLEDYYPLYHETSNSALSLWFNHAFYSLKVPYCHELFLPWVISTSINIVLHEDSNNALELSSIEFWIYSFMTVLWTVIKPLVIVIWMATITCDYHSPSYLTLSLLIMNCLLTTHYLVCL